MEIIETNNPNQSEPTQNPSFNETPQESAPPSTNTKIGKMLLIVGITVVLVIGIGMSYYFMGIQDKQSAEITSVNETSENTSMADTNTNSEINSAPLHNITWSDKTFQIQKETAYAGKETFNLNIKIPSDWTIQTNPRPEDPDNLIKNCADYVITNPTNDVSMILSPICSGWEATYSSIPINSTVVMQEKRVSDTVINNHYRIRYETSVNNFEYLDFDIESYDGLKDIGGGVDINNAEALDIVMIRFPKEDSTKDQFLPAHLTVKINSENGDKYLPLTDQMASWLRLSETDK